MIKSKCFSDKNYLIIGMGKTGCSIYKTLISSKANPYFWEDNPKISRKMQKKGYQKFSKKVDQIDYIIPSPGINIKGRTAHKLIKKLKSKKTKILSELDLFQIYLNNLKHRKKVKIIAVTGTNGKSTTVSLIHHILKQNKLNSQLAGNIGKPIFNIRPTKKGFYIIELSSYQLECSNIFQPDIACILNLTPDHLERHKSMISYAKAKLNIFKNLNSSKKGFYDNDPFLNKIIKKNFTKDKLINIRPINKDIKKSYEDLKKNEKKLLRSNQNFKFSYEILRELGLSNYKIFNSMNTFKGLKYRQQIIYSDQKKIFINDSKSTNYYSLLDALKKFREIILICGGLEKSKDINILDNNLKQIKKVIIIGENSNTLFKYFEHKVSTVYARKLNLAIIEIRNYLKINNEFNTVLFSPGAASFDQYDNFEERGKHFNNLVTRLTK